MKNLEKLTKIEAEKLALLNMMYDKVEVACDGYFCCTDSNRITIVNIDGIEVLSGEKDKLHVPGEFVFEYNHNLRNKKDCKNMRIYNILTNREASIHAHLVFYRHVSHEESAVEIEGFLFVQDGQDFFVYNNELDKIGQLIDTVRVSRFSSDSHRVFVACIRGYSRRYLKAALNKKSKKIEYYDIVDIDYNTSLVAVDKNEKGFSVNYNTLDYHKYKLMRYGVIVGNKSYEDIKKSVNGNVYFIHDFDKYRNRAVGLMDDNGNELIPPINMEIQYVGSNNYVLRKFVGRLKTVSCIYNIRNGQKSADYEDYNIVIHDTLPLVVIRKSNQTVILDTNGNLFDAKDFYKYFKCSYCSAKPNIIKVELEYGSKYIDTRLTPITNFNVIAALNQYSWVRII